MRRIMLIALLLVLSTSIAWGETFWVYKKEDGTEVTTSKWEYIPKEYRAGAYQREVDPQLHNKAPSPIAPENSIKDERTKRWKFADRYRDAMLDKGLDFYVSTDGPDSTTLVIQWILIDRPFVHNFWKNTDMMRSIRSLGFKKIRFDNGLWQLGWEARFREEYELK